MTEDRWRTSLTRAAAAGLLVASAAGLAGCGAEETAGTEAGTSVEEVQEGVDEDAGVDDAPYEGPYQGVAGDLLDLVDRRVVLSARVDEVLTPEAFLIAGTDGTDVESLLVVSPVGTSGLTEEQVVEVTGTVQESFDVPRLEAELGIDLPQGFLGDWEDQPYLLAEEVGVPAAGE